MSALALCFDLGKSIVGPQSSWRDKVARPRRSAANRAVHAKRPTGLPELRMTPVKVRRGPEYADCMLRRSAAKLFVLLAGGEPLRTSRRGLIRELETAQFESLT